MIKRFTVILLAILLVLSTNVLTYASEKELAYDNIRFVDANGDAVTALSGGAITAKVNITSNQTGTMPSLIVSSFENGLLNGIWYETLETLTGEISLTFTPVTTSAETVIKANVMGNLKKMSKPSIAAKAGVNSTELKRLAINGETVEEYASDVDVYLKLISADDKVEITATPEDAGTKVEITEAQTVPGVSTVKLTSASNEERLINIVTCSDVAQLTIPTKLAYIVGEEEIEIELVANQTEYEITLPDNTFYTTVVAEALSVADISVGVKDINHKANTYDGISYVPGELAGTFTATYAERPSVNNLIPIKNEETHAIVNVEYDGVKIPYTIKFKAKQPRLTAFNMTGASDDKYKPMFVSGAAVNNDNGTSAGTDRSWSLGNISEKFVGGSLIALSTKWYNDTATCFLKINTTGEFFNFTADTKGTAYFFARAEMKNTEEFEMAGWEDARNVENVAMSDKTNKELLDALGVTSPTDSAQRSAALKALDKTMGFYEDGKNAIIMYEWADIPARYSIEGLSGDTPATGAYPYVYVYKKAFEKGENVSVPHPGITSGYQMLDIIIVWDIDSVEGGNVNEN